MSRTLRRTRLVRLALAGVLGALTMLSLPPWGLWPLGPVGFGLWLRFCDPGPDGGRWRDRLASACAFWLGAYLLGLFWMTELTVPGWAAALPVETLIMALPTSIIATRGTWRMVTAAAALVVGEAARWTVPFGGVAMSNLALGQVDGPWLAVASAAGSLGIIAVVGVGAVVVERLCAREWVQVWQPALVLTVVSVAVLAVPDTAVSATIDAAVVQAGGELGTDVGTPQRSVRLRHLATTAEWSGTADLMVWSESSTSSDGPLEESPRLAELEALASERDLVLVANFYERTADESPPRFRNATVAVGPSFGLTDRYDKAHLVPFGEYVPLRGLVEPFADLSLIAREAIAGEGPGVVKTPLGDVAVATSYEIYFPGLVRAGVRAGGSIVANPTLASSYRSSVVPSQSLASARLRAVETRRWVLQASTTGYSAIVAPDGTVIARSELREPAVLVAPVELRTGTTPAVALGMWPLAIAAAAVLAWRGLRLGDN
ncbi:apolipoprotein N-acyltransferase [Candidatus Poriferisodalis sp.]|uniref:apolipoprotein N-acyltransferase n=1 Tax=Candidatus Poriferisodalis sp. TaxID=3101277 RepID=UPI003B520854